MDILPLFAAMLFFGVLGAAIGAYRKRAMLGFLLGAALGPVGALIALFVRDRRPRCPHCRGPLPDAAAALCMHCARPLHAPVFTPAPE